QDARPPVPAPLGGQGARDAGRRGPVGRTAAPREGGRGRRAVLPRDHRQLHRRSRLGIGPGTAGHPAHGPAAAVRQARLRRGRRGTEAAGRLVTAARAARDGVPGPGQVRAPEPLPAAALDAHCHLDLIEEPTGEVLAAARAAGITRVVTVGVDLPSSRWSAGQADPGQGVYAAVAVHPNETAAPASSPTHPDAGLAGIAKLAGLPQVRAVGETGLDYYRDYAAPEIQRDWFRAHIDIAKQAGKALMIHDREAHDDVLAILEADGPPERVVFH